ncbi:MAG: universal stress protein, partial [Candidatus Limnocylindrales bacterium]
MARRRSPSRILIPLANPRTAADLIRIGSALMEQGGTLTALGIVEVPEGMPLSEGATKARQARRLLQRVLEFAPPGVELRTVVRIGRRAAEGIVELAAEEEADLILFGWAGKPAGRRGVPD